VWWAKTVTDNEEPGRNVACTSFQCMLSQARREQLSLAYPGGPDDLAEDEAETPQQQCE